MAPADSSPAPVGIDQFSLEQQCHTFLMHGLAPSTRKTYATAQRKFFNFCLLPVIHKDTGRGPGIPFSETDVIGSSPSPHEESQWWILGTSEVCLTPGLGSPLRFRGAWGCWEVRRSPGPLLFAGSSSLQAPWRAAYFGWFPLAGLPCIPPCFA